MASTPVTIRARLEEDGPVDPDVGTLVLVTESSAVSSGSNLPLATTDDVITVTPAVFQIEYQDGRTPEPVTPLMYFVLDGAVISGTDGDTVYTVLVADAGSTLNHVAIASGPNGQELSSQIGAITIAAGTPGAAPSAPVVGDWEMAASYYDPESQTENFRAQVTLLGTVASTAVDAQWTTSGSVPALASHWETLENVTGDTYKTVMLNTGSGDYGLFTEGQIRREQFRIRYRTAAGGEWSLESDTKIVPLPAALALPGVPTSPLAVAETSDGEITVSATAPASWGDYTAGVIQWSVDGNNWNTFTSPATVTLDSSNYGQSRVIQFRALADEGVPGPTVSAAAITVPGTPVSAGIDLSKWYTFKFTSPVAIASEQAKIDYFAGFGGFPKQFLVAGDRSPVDPNVVAFGEDVATVWVTENAEDDYPYYRLGESIGIGNRYSIAIKFDPDTRERFIYCVLGSGLFLTDNLGKNYRKVLNVTNVPGGSSQSYGGRYRAFRHLFDYDPADHTRWFFANSNGSVYRSTNRGESWTAISSAPSSQNWDVCYHLKVDYGDSNKLWAVCWTGLYRSTNGGVTWAKQTPSGLPSGNNALLVSADFNPTNPNDFYIVAFDQGLYRTTNGGTSFSKVSTPHNAIAQVAVSPVNRSHIWLMTPNRGYPSGNPGKKSLFSNNSGASWSNVVTEHNTYGWEGVDGGTQAWSIPFRTVGYKADRNAIEQQNVILPSPNVATKAIATTQVTMWRTNNGGTWYHASHGFDTLAGGEANTNSIGWSKSDDDLSVWVLFDVGYRKSTNGLASFTGMNIVSSGVTFDVGGGSCAIHPTQPNRMLFTRGSYINPVTLLVSTNGGATTGGSFRPAAFSNTGIGYKIHWCEWHAAGNSTAYCQKGKSTDYGTNWTYWHNFGGLPDAFCGASNRAAGVHGMSPVNGNILYAFNDDCLKIKRTTNGGTSWSDIGGGGNVGPGRSRDQPYSFHVDPLDANVAWWWVKDQGLKKYDASTGNITTHATEWKSLPIGRIRVSPLNNDHIYLMYDSFAADGENAWVLRSTNGAAGPFLNISANLPRVGSNRSIEIEPSSGVVFCIGTAGTRMFAPPGGSARFTQIATDMKLQT